MRRSTLIASLLFSILTLFISGCTQRPEAADAVVTDASLPQVVVNGYLSDMDAIAFEWKPVTDPRVVGVRIYRDNPGDAKDAKTYRIATVEGTLTTHYVDKGLQPATAYRYRFTTYDAKGHESRPNATVTAKTLGIPDAVSFFTATKELARSAKLLWRPHPDQRITAYEIDRLDPGEKEFRRIAVVEGRLNAEYIDHGLEDDKIYRYRIIAVTYDGQQSAPSTVITVATKPLPLSPQNAQAGKNGIQRIALQWKAPANKDIVYYNVYRAENPQGYYEYLAKVPATAFTDKVGQNGATYYYKVTAVDKDGLESLPGEVVTGTTMAAPNAPTLDRVAVQEDAVVIAWTKSDPRTVSYDLVKTTHKGWFDTNETVYRDLKTTSFTDPNIVGGVEYSYEVVAVDANGLKSAPSESKTVIVEAK